jgi:hypothetical protein
VRGAEPILLLEVSAGDVKVVRLRDFASAGQAGSSSRSWLPTSDVRAEPRGDS